MSTEETTTIVIPPREDSQEWHGPPPLSSESPREPDSPTDSVKAGGMARQTKYKVRTIPFLRQLKKMIEV